MSKIVIKTIPEGFYCQVEGLLLNPIMVYNIGDENKDAIIKLNKHHLIKTMLLLRIIMNLDLVYFDNHLNNDWTLIFEVGEVQHE